MTYVQQPAVYVEADRITMKWAQNWQHFGFGRRLFLTLLDSDKAHRAQLIANGQAVVVMPQRRREGLVTRYMRS